MPTRDRIPPRGPARDAYLTRKYGITQADFEAMLRDQDKRCAICRRSVSRSSHWAIDHDHFSNLVRGVVCRDCNLLLGYAEDDVEMLQAAVDYLRREKRR